MLENQSINYDVYVAYNKKTKALMVNQKTIIPPQPDNTYDIGNDVKTLRYPEAKKLVQSLNKIDPSYSLKWHCPKCRNCFIHTYKQRHIVLSHNKNNVANNVANSEGFIPNQHSSHEIFQQNLNFSHNESVSSQEKHVSATTQNELPIINYSAVLQGKNISQLLHRFQSIDSIIKAVESKDVFALYQLYSSFGKQIAAQPDFLSLHQIIGSLIRHMKNMQSPNSKNNEDSISFKLHQLKTLQFIVSQHLKEKNDQNNNNTQEIIETSASPQNYQDKGPQQDDQKNKNTSQSETILEENMVKEIDQNKQFIEEKPDLTDPKLKVNSNEDSSGANDLDEQNAVSALMTLAIHSPKINTNIEKNQEKISAMVGETNNPEYVPSTSSTLVTKNQKRSFHAKDNIQSPKFFKKDKSDSPSTIRKRNQADAEKTIVEKEEIPIKYNIINMIEDKDLPNPEHQNINNNTLLDVPVSNYHPWQDDFNQIKQKEDIRTILFLSPLKRLLYLSGKKNDFNFKYEVIEKILKEERGNIGNYRDKSKKVLKESDIDKSKKFIIAKKSYFFNTKNESNEMINLAFAAYQVGDYPSALSYFYNLYEKNFNKDDDKAFLAANYIVYISNLICEKKYDLPKKLLHEDYELEHTKNKGKKKTDIPSASDLHTSVSVRTIMECLKLDEVKQYVEEIKKINNKIVKIPNLGNAVERTYKK